MSAGWQPSLDVPTKPFSQGGFTAPPEVPSFSIEMVVGSRPSSPRILLGARIPLPVAQPTHVSAPFTPEMAYGSKPDQPRQPFHAPQGWSDSQLTFFVAMTPEMFQGWHPDTSRVLLGARIPQPVSQTTQTNAPFSPEMAAGQKPDQPRPPFQAPVGWAVSQPTFVVPMTPEMFAGNMPDRGRQLVGARIPLPVSQPTHTSAPFTSDMVAGHHPDSPRLFRYKLGCVDATWLLKPDAIVYVVSDASVTTIDAIATRTTDSWTVRTIGDV
jgi:hypothetical protein